MLKKFLWGWYGKSFYHFFIVRKLIMPKSQNQQLMPIMPPIRDTYLCDVNSFMPTNVDWLAVEFFLFVVLNDVSCWFPETIGLVKGVRGGTHGQILLRACTEYISDSEPGELGELGLRTILPSYNLNIFFSWFSITIFFICMNSLRYKKIYTTFFIIWFYNFQYSQDVQFMFIIFSLVQKIIRISSLNP